jgi:hypothetical protein
MMVWTRVAERSSSSSPNSSTRCRAFTSDQADALELVKGIPVAVKLIIAYYPDREDSSSAPSTFAIIPSD